MPTFIRPTKTTLAALAAATVLAACSGTDTVSNADEPTPAPSSETTSATASPTPSASDEPTPTGPLLSVTIAGEQVRPNAQEIDLATGEKLMIEVESDRAGELHVHSTPEQFVEFDAGSTRTQLVIETPGSVEVEDHDTSAVVALIEVR
ncbi:hypothetical protein [Nocardioides pyridinolyticus]